MNYNYLQLILGILSIIALIFGAKGKYIMWPLQILCAFLNILVYYHYHLYAKSMISSITIFITIYGMYKWLNKKEDTKKTFNVSTLENKKKLATILVGLSITILLGTSLNRYTDADFAYLDSFCASFTLIAKWLLSNKKIEAWPMLVIIDIIYMKLCLHKDMYFLAIKYGIYIIIGIYGYRTWYKLMKHSNK
jgi:nicotinamide mononucleotide transporter